MLSRSTSAHALFKKSILFFFPFGFIICAFCTKYLSFSIEKDKSMCYNDSYHGIVSPNFSGGFDVSNIVPAEEFSAIEIPLAALQVIGTGICLSAAMSISRV